jgi:hypothetical protein
MTIIGLLDYWRFGFGVEFQLSSLWVGGCCDRGRGTVQEPKSKKTSTVGSRYQVSGEDKADRDDSMGVIVNCSV